MIVYKAGGIIARNTERGVEVLCIHRSRYNDWSFPKGHVESGESMRDAALREIREETGLECSIVSQLPDMKYVLPDATQCVVAMFVCVVDQENIHAKDSEADELRWVLINEATTMISYESVRTYIIENKNRISVL